jgi:hypothetical protein
VVVILLLGLPVLSGCSGETTSNGTADVAIPTWSPVVADALAEYAEDGLPEVEAERIEDYLDLLDLGTTGENGRRRARQRLQDEDAAMVTSAMLSIVEGRDAEAYLRSEAYAWLREFGVAAMMPRLALRLKYEKDWVANVDIAVGLLRFGCGAGLEPMVTILRTEEGIAELEEARWAAVAALNELPVVEDWTPGLDFDSDWRHLLAVDEEWRHNRLLPGWTGSPTASRPMRAEMWKTIAKLRSQRLRPVDDARYVLTRLPTWVFDPLCETAYDENRYVREHALQTLAWSDSTVGRWAQSQHYDLATKLTPLLADAAQRGRVLEAMGASGLSSMQQALLPWLQQGGLEESTAAADALLRCADQQMQRPIEALLDSNAPLGPEGRYALELLRARLDPTYTPVVPSGLDPSEQARRDRWASARG